MSVDSTFSYQVCGVRLSSEIILNELATYNFSFNNNKDDDFITKSSSDINFVSNPDQKLNSNHIIIKRGSPVIPFRQKPIVIKPFSKFNASEYYFEQPGVIRFLVRDGSEIIIEFLTVDENYALQSIYQNALPIALMQRGIIVFRASGIVDNDGQVWMFFAPPRSGKSATALFLIERGYRFFSDNMIAIRLIDGKLLAQPFSPSLHVWSHVLDKQTIFDAKQAKPLRESIPKLVVTVDQSKFDPMDRLVKGLIQVEYLTNELVLAPISMISAFETLRNAVYHFHITAEFGLEPKIFEIITSIVKQTQLIQVGRPKLKESFHEIAEFIDTKIINGGKDG